jgi:hypothetical protein
MHTANATSTLFPEHQADLDKSGLSPETIAAAGLYSVTAAELEPILDWVPPVESGLVFPYLTQSDFSRVKVFPAFQDAEGRTVKYLQRAHSGCEIYVPPGVQRVLPNPTILLGWTEGEKKGLKATQEEVFCLGLGGLWNWLQDGRPLPLLEKIAHVERQEILYPDSGVWTRDDLLQPVYALGKELELRGAKVRVAIIPPNPDGSEQKLDDLLVSGRREAVDKLPTVPLTHKVFSHTAEWWKRWRAQSGRNGHTTVASEELLAQMTTTRTLHPAQDYVDGVLYIGVPVDDYTVLLTSNRQALQAHELPAGLRIDDRGFDLCRFSKEGVLAYMAGAEVIGYDLVERLEQYFKRYAFFRDARIPLLLAVWTIGTYVYRVFFTFPYLLLRSPRKRCGKSRVEDLLAEVAFNAEPRTTNPTEAAIFRGPARNGGTLLLDEIEGLKGDRERYAGLLAVLNDGYKRGGEVTRMEKHGDRFVAAKYPTYAPKVLAGISKLAETLEDRGIPIFMTRRLPQDALERFSPRRLAQDIQRLRDECYVWALTRAEDLADLYEADGEEALNIKGLDDRALELWEPLLTIADAVDQEAENAGKPPTLVDTLTALALELAGVRDDADTTTTQLLNALLTILTEAAKTEERYPPGELLSLVQAKGFTKLKSTKGLANVMQPLGLIAKTTRFLDGTRKLAYHLSTALLEDLRSRYGSPEDRHEEETPT